MPQPIDGRARRILVVDDDPAILELIKTRLALAGFHVLTARDGLEAVQRLGPFRPEAMVLDINMPRLDGFGVLAHMRQAGVVEKIPTLVLTARSQATDVQTAIQMGARDYLSKPFRDDQLLSRVARLFARRALAA